MVGHPSEGMTSKTTWGGRWESCSASALSVVPFLGCPPKNKDRRFVMIKFQLFSGKIYKVSTTEWLFMEKYIKEIATIVVDAEDMKDMGEITECNHTQKSNLPSYRSHKFV